jgi:hypothetical protein
MYKVKAVVMALCLTLPFAAYAAVRVPQSEIDLGRIYRDEPQKIVFTLLNVSDDTLYILDIEPSCDCTTAQIVPDPIPPRGEGQVLTFFDPMGYEGRGRIEEYVRLNTSDLTDPEIMLVYWVEVAVGPEPEPRALKFGRICRGESDTMNVRLSPGPEEDLKVLDAYSDTACVVVEWAGTDREGRRDFKVIVANDEACGRVASFVTFVTSDTLRPNIRIPVTVSLISRIVADPDLIAFGPTLPGAYVSQGASIYSREELRFEIARVLSTVPDLEPEIERLAADSFNLRLRVKEDASAGRVSGEIRLETDCPDEPPVVVQVTGYIRGDK